MSKKEISPKLYDVIRRPIITEKATLASEQGKIVFEVDSAATKPLVKASFEALFGAKVAKINIINLPRKSKRFKGVSGFRNGKKKAIITLKDNQEIDVMAGVN